MNAILKVKNRIVVWVQNDCECIDCLHLWLCGWLETMGLCLVQEKVKIQGTVSVEWGSLSHRCKVEKSWIETSLTLEPSLLILLTSNEKVVKKFYRLLEKITLCSLCFWCSLSYYLLALVRFDLSHEGFYYRLTSN